MVSDEIKVSQNFSQISQVSQSCFLSSSQGLTVLDFFAELFSDLNLSLVIQRANIRILSRREKPWFCPLAKSPIYRLPPL